MTETINTELLTTLERAVTLLKATQEFIRANHVGGLLALYDDAESDGYCLSEDCGITIEEAETAIQKARKENV